MPAKTCLVLHKKSCTKPEVKAAVKHVRESGIDVDVYIPWSRKDLRRFVRQAIEDGAERIVAGGGDVKDAFAARAFSRWAAWASASEMAKLTSS